MASAGAGQGSPSNFGQLANISYGHGGLSGKEITGGPSGNNNNDGSQGDDGGDNEGSEQPGAAGAAPRPSRVNPCSEPRDIVGFRWHVTAVLHSTQTAQADRGTPVPEAVAALGPWPPCSTEVRRCQNHGAHMGLGGQFVCAACLDYTQRLLRAVAPELFDENLWLPFCRRCSLGLRARNEGGAAACVCPLGEPGDDWMFNGKLFCAACRVETLTERRVRNRFAWEARAQGRTVQVFFNGALVNSLAKDRCACLRHLDGGDVWACPMCSGVRPE